ncbi:MAG: type II toxin-antitoxin system HicB family antitoxin [Actinomycetota bacterium]|nr:type II toxin-antitoxin system HicB family antitoxin [Actinomycetota bacterium]
MNAPAYPITVFWSAEDSAWVADVPDLPYCSATGDTPHEAVAEVETAIGTWFEAAQSSGRSTPVPSARFAHARGSTRAAV